MEYEGQPETTSGARLFVYGTLRKGFRTHKLLQRFHARLIASGSVRGRLYDLGNYPGAVDCTGAERVCGEVYFLPRPSVAFRALDRYEGFNPVSPESSEFQRRKTTVTLAGGHKLLAWIYWLPAPPAKRRRIRAGNYAMRRR